MSDGTKSVSTHIADWASGIHPEDIPVNVRRHAQTCLMDTIAVAIAGTQSKVAALARSLYADDGRTGNSTVLGANRLLPACDAAFVNGSAAHALDFDDNCYAGFVHGSAVIAPAALAVGQKRGMTGADLVTAFIVGSECQYAIGAASQNVLYDLGWWTTGVLGSIGSSIAAGRLLGLPSFQMHAALGLAMAATGGMKICFGVDAKALMAGRASELGVTSAELAALGATGSERPFEDKNGFIHLFNAGTFDFSSIGLLGKQWHFEVPGVDIKRIPVCLSSHAAVDAVSDLVAEHGLDVAKIDAVQCDVPAIVRANLRYDRPATAREAQFSMPFAIAAALRFGSIELRHLQDDVVHNPELQQLMARVSMTSGSMWHEPGMRQTAPEGAHVRIALRDGSYVEGFRDKAYGTAAYPLSPEQVSAKFFACVTPVLGAGQAGRLHECLEQLDSPALLRNLFRDIDFESVSKS